MHLSHLVAAACAVALPLSAQITTASKTIGGAGAYGCQGAGDPPPLSDGSLGEAELGFTYDQSTCTLTLEVTNTSPVTVGVPNPLITRIWFNLPLGAVDTVSFLDQRGSGGATPSFSLAFDVSPGDGVDENRANCFGSFGIALTNGGSIIGGIANAGADTISAPPGSWVEGPVEFDIRLGGPGAMGIDASTIANALSVGAAQRAMNVAAKFQAAGIGGEASGTLGNAVDCSTSIYVVGVPQVGGRFEFCVSGQVGCHICIWASADPGPTQFGPWLIPIGLPILASLDFGGVPPSGVLCLPVVVPNDPSLANTTVYFTNVTFPPNDPTDISFAPRYTLTIQP